MALEDLGDIFLDQSSFCLCKSIFQSDPFASATVGARQRGVLD